MDAVYSLVGLVGVAVVAVLIAQDANRRGMNGLGWGIFTFLLCVFAIPTYLIVRRPIIDGK